MPTHYGFWTLTLLVVANMVGAGVFTTSGFALEDLGSPSLVLAVWALGGLIALAGAASYGMLVRALPESGGEYLFLSRVAHPLLGFIAGWVSLVAGFTGAIALAALTFEQYMLPAGLRPPWCPPGGLAVLIIVAAGAAHARQPAVGAAIQNAAVLAKLTLLAGFLVIAGAAFAAGQGAPVTSAQAQQSTENWATNLAVSLVWISLSYSGFNAAVYVAGEATDARRVVPRALLTGTLAVSLLYLLLNAAFVYAAPVDRLANEADIAAVAAAALGGPWLERLIRVGVGLCLLTSVFGMLMAAPRVYAKMADDGLLPGVLRAGDSAPATATLLQVVLAATMVMASGLRELLSYLGLTLSLCAALSVACLFAPSVRRDNRWGLWAVAPVLYITATLVLGAVMVYQELVTQQRSSLLLGVAATFSLGVVAYAVQRRLNPERTG